MDIGYKIKKLNPKQKANCLSKLFFGWMYQTVKKGTKQSLELKDLYAALPDDKSDKLADNLEKNWAHEIKTRSKNPSLFRAIRKTFWLQFFAYGLCWFLLNAIIRCTQPLILSQVIYCFSGSDSKVLGNDKYVYSALLVIVSTVGVFFTHHTSFGLAVIGMRIRIAASSLIYRKITRLSQSCLGEAASGKVVNLLANDVNRFDLVTIPLHAVWVLPFQVVFLSWIIWRQIGACVFVGVLTVIVFSVPVQVFLGKYIGRFRLSISKKTDKRVRLMHEIIAGIQVIKMYVWEKPFEKIVKVARAHEINDLTKTSYLRGVFASSMVFIDRTALAVTLITYVLLGNNLSADIVFSLAQSFNILQSAIAIYFPLAITQGAEALISIKRLQDFLLLEEKKPNQIEELHRKGIVINSVTASWGETNTLKDLSMTVPPGTLCAVIGPVGAGKSSLLQLLLGELPPKSGTIQIGGNISYSSQQPWLFQSTVRNNILFGEDYDKFLYDKVVKVCALEKDLEQLPQGDKTVVGERGVSLSGGQRARINLARAVYRQADIYLFDDPLSAVDTHVGKHLFEECINKYLKGNIRILVTHQLQYLKKANLIVVLNENGIVEAQGTFDDLSRTKLDFTKLLVDNEEYNEKSDQETDLLSSLSCKTSRRTSTISLEDISETIEYVSESEENDNIEISAKNNLQPFKKYLKATNQIFLLILLVLMLILAQGFLAGSDLFLAIWTSQQEQILNATLTTTTIKPITTSPITEKIEVHVLGDKIHPPHSYIYTLTKKNPIESIVSTPNIASTNLIDKHYAIYLYLSLIIGAIILTTGRSFLFFKMCMLSSTNLHKQIFRALLGAPMKFFDANPSGRILNRFSKDMGAIDEILPKVLLNAIQIILVMFGVLINIVISNHYIIIALIILGGLFIKLRNWYISTAKALKHLEGVAKSPVFSHVNSTLHGITTIRALKAEEILTEEFDEHQDVHTSAWFLTIASMYSFGLWLDIICVLFAAAVIFSFIILQKYINGSMVGLAISQSLVLTGMLQYGIRETAEVINQLTSVERILQYTTIDQEGPFETPAHILPANWPKRGRVEFKNLSLRYSEDCFALNNLSFVINPGEKVGIVGRTGAGKSSLISALFRLTPFDGYIFIDDVDTKTIGLGDLRKRISIIPQEPVLFSASLRYNLDPFGEFHDDEIWRALGEVGLKEVVANLDCRVNEGGGNFSVGQRQLICLARAILRDNKILILDEATANVDLRTDSFIQETIRKKFKNCTVLTIAHRLNTIMDSDRVLVMSFGYSVEFDHPHKLLQAPEGTFFKLVQETGSVMSMQLKDMAMEAYNKYS